MSQHFYLLAWHRFADFSGRSQRAEFWTFTLVNWALLVVLGAIGGLFGGDGSLLTGLFSLLVLVPSLAVTARRLHDVGRSGWWMLAYCIPFLGLIPFLYWNLKPSDEGFNRFGQNPVGMIVANAKTS